MSIAIMSQVWTIPLPDSEKLVLLALADAANDDGVCWPSMASLVAKCSKSDRTIQAAIKALTGAGHLQREERVGRGVVYTVTPRKDFTPEAASPPKGTTSTPEAASDKPSRTIIPQKASPSSGKRARAPRTPPMLDPLWIVPDDWRAWATDKLPHWPPGRVDQEAESFADYWRTDPKTRARKISDWPAAWRQWCRNSERFDNERTGSPATRSPARGAGRGSVTDAVLAAHHGVDFERFALPG